MKKPSLTVLGGPLAGQKTLLPEDGVVTIGSAPECTFQLDVPTVDPRHARLVLEKGAATAFATGAEPPVHINDNPLGTEGATLRNGDILWLGVPGEDGVVMVQCILAPVAASSPTPVAGPAAPTPEIETQALYAVSPPPALPPLPTAQRTGHEPTIALDPLRLQAPTEAATPPPEEQEPLFMVFDSSTEDEAVVVDESDLIDVEALGPVGGDDSEEAVVVDEDELLAEVTPTFVGSAPDLSARPLEPDAAEPQSAPDAPEPELLTEILAPPDVPLEVAPQTPVAAPPATPEAAPASTSPEAAEAEPPIPVSEPPSPAPAEPPPPPSTARAPLRPAGPAAPARRPTAPIPESDPGQLLEDEEAYDDDYDDDYDGEGSPRGPVLFAFLGFLAVLVVAGLGWAVWRFVVAPPAPASTPVAAAVPQPVRATPTPAAPAAPTAATAAAGPETPPPATATPSPAATPVPAPATAPQATPTPRPTPTPPPPAASAAPQRSAAEQRAQQTASRIDALLAQADAALAAQQYEAAIGHVDEVLGLDAANTRARATRLRAVTLMAQARRRFVATRTRVQTAQDDDAGLAGFDTGDTVLREAPDFQGRIEFEMDPASGIQAGDAWTLRVFVVNGGQKPIRIQSIDTVTQVNGAGRGGAIGPQTRQVPVQQRVLVGELSGTWDGATTAWSTQVTVTANKGQSLTASITWR